MNVKSLAIASAKLSNEFTSITNFSNHVKALKLGDFNFPANLKLSTEFLLILRKFLNYFSLKKTSADIGLIDESVLACAFIAHCYFETGCNAKFESKYYIGPAGVSKKYISNLRDSFISQGGIEGEFDPSSYVCYRSINSLVDVYHNKTDGFAKLSDKIINFSMLLNFFYSMHYPNRWLVEVVDKKLDGLFVMNKPKYNYTDENSVSIKLSNAALGDYYLRITLCDFVYIGITESRAKDLLLWSTFKAGAISTYLFTH